MIDGIRPEHERLILDTLYRDPKVEKVILYGSRARGSQQITSDIDLAICGSQLTLLDMARLEEDLAELPIAQASHLLHYDTLAYAPLKDEIDREGRVLFPTSTEMKL